MEQDKIPAVSILITTYNRARILPDAIACVLWQDFADFELVIYDDCSSDNTAEVAAGFKDPRIRYVRGKENLGSKVGHRGLWRRFIYEWSRPTKYITVLCDDDLWIRKNLISRQVAILEKRPEVTLILGGTAFIVPQPNLPRTPVPNAWNAWLKDLPNAAQDYPWLKALPHTYMTFGLFPHYLKGSEYINLLADDPGNRNLGDIGCVYRREDTVRSGLFKEDVGYGLQMGYELKVGYASLGNVCYMDTPSVAIRVHETTMSYSGNAACHIEDCLHAIDLGFRHVLATAAGADLSRWRYLKRKMQQSVMIRYHFATQFRCTLFGNKPNIPNASFWELLRLVARFRVPVNARNIGLMLIDRMILPPLNRVLLWIHRWRLFLRDAETQWTAFKERPPES